MTGQSITQGVTHSKGHLSNRFAAIVAYGSPKYTAKAIAPEYVHCMRPHLLGISQQVLAQVRCHANQLGLIWLVPARALASSPPSTRKAGSSSHARDMQVHARDLLITIIFQDRGCILPPWRCVRSSFQARAFRSLRIAQGWWAF